MSEQRPRFLLGLLGTAHAVADASAAFLLASLAMGRSPLEIAFSIALYNAIAFGAQTLAGLLVDRAAKPRLAVLVALFCLALALLLSHRAPTAAVLLAGWGSALFHPGGGAIACSLSSGKTAELAIFAAPGVVGLSIGTLLGLGEPKAIAPFVAALGLLAGAMALFPLPALPPSPSNTTPLESREVWIVALLGAIAARSAIWGIFQHLYAERLMLLPLLALAAALGKLLGGFLSDRVGYWRWMQFSLSLALPLLWLGDRHFIALLLGIALLQSTTPIAWAAMLHLVPRYPATATGLTLGLAIALGGLLALSVPLTLPH